MSTSAKDKQTEKVKIEKSSSERDAIDHFEYVFDSMSSSRLKIWNATRTEIIDISRVMQRSKRKETTDFFCLKNEVKKSMSEHVLTKVQMNVFEDEMLVK